MPRRINISEARARLPELAHYVASSPDRVVLIDHRDVDGPFALTTAAHLDYLNTLVDELRKRLGEPFRLAGSIESDLTADELEADLDAAREEQRRLAEVRLRSLGE